MALFWFDTRLGPLTISSSQELSLVLGAKTFVQLTGSSAVQIFGLAQTGGNVDGAVVTFANVSNGASTTFQFMEQSGSASSPVNRFRNGGVNVTIGALYGGVTYRYDASLLRWVMIASGSS